MDSRTTASPVKVPDSRDNRLERGSPQTASTAITPFQAFLRHPRKLLKPPVKWVFVPSPSYAVLWKPTA